MIMYPPWKTLLTITIFSLLLSLSSQQSFDYPTANLSTTWKNTPTLKAAVFPFMTVRLVLLRGTAVPNYACGFYCNGTCNTFMFSVFIVHVDGDGEVIFNQSEYPQVVWSANRHNPVGENATLELTRRGDLVLKDADGSLRWSTNTAGRSVVGLNLTETGNLVLFGSKKAVVWQSFDHPTDALVPGQVLLSGTNLTSGGSTTDWSKPGLFSVSMTEEGLKASILSNPPQIYLEWLFSNSKQSLLVCGRYGICSSGQCSCPVPVSGKPRFRPVNNRRPDFGCNEIVPITCSNSSLHRFMDLEDVNYFSFNYDIMNTNMKRCKEACLKNCSCKAAVFQPGVSSDMGGCYLPNEIFSLMDKAGARLTRFNSTVSLKVQIDPNAKPCQRSNTF